MADPKLNEVVAFKAKQSAQELSLSRKKKRSLSDEEHKVFNDLSTGELGLALKQERKRRRRKEPKLREENSTTAKKPLKSESPELSDSRDVSLRTPDRAAFGKYRIQLKEKQKERGNSRDLNFPACIDHPLRSSMYVAKQKISLQEWTNLSDRALPGDLSGWAGLTEDILDLILTRMGTKSLLFSSQVCASWRRLAVSDKIWSTAYEKRWGSLPPERPAAWPRRGEGMCWMEAYIQRARGGPNSVSCPFCGKAVASDDSHGQYTHLLTHEKRYKCTVEGCGKSYGCKRDLQSHMASDEGRGGHGKKDALRYQCSVCEKPFRCDSRLKSHVKAVHEKVKPSVVVGPSKRDVRFNCTASKCRRSYLQISHMLEHCQATGHVPPLVRGKHKQRGGAKKLGKLIICN